MKARDLKRTKSTFHFSDRIRLAMLQMRTSRASSPPPMDKPVDTDDPFAARFDAVALERARRLLGRVMGVAASVDVSLYLSWGTLLGHVREGRMLPWDDDIDLALYDPAKIETLETALVEAGLRLHETRSNEEFWIKIFDPENPITSQFGWSYPFVDVFVYGLDNVEAHSRWLVQTVSGSDVLPGRPVIFEEVACMEPQWPMSILDEAYPDWRTIEQSPSWDHRAERRLENPLRRAVKVDWTGRKRSPG